MEIQTGRLGVHMQKNQKDVKNSCLGNRDVAVSDETEGLMRGIEQGELEQCSCRTGG